MKKLFPSLLLLLLFGLGFTASEDDLEMGPAVDEIVDPDGMGGLTGIVKLEEGFEGWDAAYLTKYGYFCYNKDAYVAEDGSEDEATYSSVSYLSLDKKDTISVIINREGNLPSQMLIGGGVVFFSFPNDTIMELLFDDGKNVKMLDSIAYNKKDLAAYGDLADDKAFTTALSNTASLLNTKAAAVSSVISTSFLNEKYGKKFAEIAGLNYQKNPEVVAKEEVNAKGNIVPIADMLAWYKNNLKNALSGVLSLWTGNATFKVGGSSCTLSGTIWFPSNLFNKFGTYGILCDEDPANLVLGKAEYEGEGYQGPKDMAFDVDFRGFKPNTTYYYRSYFKFSSNDHGGIIPRHGSSLDAEFYDTTIKSFTTGNNNLTVDVAMCIDVTGSMYNIINTVKQNAIGFYDAFDKVCKDKEIILDALNVQVYYYRDVNVDGTAWIGNSRKFSLPAEQEQYADYVNGLYASGGGDTPESGMEVLKEAFTKTEWGVDDGYHRQVCILWTDADFLSDPYYTQTPEDEVKSLWDAMPSGRRMVLFAPYGTFDYNSSSWGNLDSWKNVMHEDNLYDGFNNFTYILESIIGELTSKSPSSVKAKAAKKSGFPFGGKN